MTEPRRPWVKFELPDDADRKDWADFLQDLDSWLRLRGDRTTIYDVQPVRDESPADRRSGVDRRLS